VIKDFATKPEVLRYAALSINERGADGGNLNRTRRVKFPLLNSASFCSFWARQTKKTYGFFSFVPEFADFNPNALNSVSDRPPPPVL